MEALSFGGGAQFRVGAAENGGAYQQCSGEVECRGVDIGDHPVEWSASLLGNEHLPRNNRMRALWQPSQLVANQAAVKPEPRMCGSAPLGWYHSVSPSTQMIAPSCLTRTS